MIYDLVYRLHNVHVNVKYMYIRPEMQYIANQFAGHAESQRTKYDSEMR